MDAAVQKLSGKGVRIVRISDAHTPEDLRAALSGSGMFGGARLVILDGVFGNEGMRVVAEDALPAMKKSPETFFILEEKPLADVRKKIEKFAEKAERFDAPAKKKDDSIFGLANALQRGKKKELWIGYQKELAVGKSPEAIHGVLFWAAKQALLRNVRDARARELVAKLAELPHESRRRGLELEYALELFVLR